MKDISAEFNAYRTTFPSDIFLKKYYGKNRRLKRVLLDTLLPFRGHREGLYQYLRNQFDMVLRTSAMHLIRFADREENGFENTSVFEDYHCSAWVRTLLETNDLAAELTLDAEAELCAEYIEQYRTGAFYEDSWWKWFAEDGTIGITVNPDALQSGGNRTRTLEEFIHESDTIE